MSLHQQLLAATEPFIARERHIGREINRLRGALRAVVELHAPAGGPDLTVCRGCDQVGWPCPTMLAIGRELGIEANDHG